MKTDIKNKLDKAYRGGLTDKKLSELLEPYMPPERPDLSNPVQLITGYAGVNNMRIYCHNEDVRNKAIKHAYAVQKLRNALDKERGDWRPDWKVVNPGKCYPFLDGGVLQTSYNFNHQHLPSWAYLPSTEAWQRVIAEVGEPCVMMALFEIEEDE